MEEVNISLELTFTIMVNVVALAFFCGIYIHTILTHDKKFEELKEYFNEKINEIKENFKEHLERVEHKQEKHNNLIERMVKVEQSTASAHHRLDDIIK